MEPRRDPWYEQPQEENPPPAKRKLSDRISDAWQHTWFRRLVYLAVWWLWTPAVYYAGYALRYITPGHKAERFHDQFLMGNIFSHGALFLGWICIGFVGSLVIILLTAHHDDSTDYEMNWRPSKLHKNVPTHRSTGKATFALVSLFAVLALVSGVQFVRVAHNDSIDVSRYVGQSTVIYVQSLSPSSAPELSRLFPSLRQGDGQYCDLVGPPGLPSCVKQGVLSTTGWDGRVSSLSGSITALTRYSASGNNQSLKDQTVTYLNTKPGQPARWSGIVDGKGNGTGIGQVAEWNGTSESSCDFKGPYAIDRSFGGSNKADMADLLETSYPRFSWKLSDVWGYCNGSQPIVVVPMTRQMYWANRTVDTYAGIVLIQGDNGHTKLTYVPHPKLGAYPGPVYPASLADTQLDQVSWMAGRRAHDDFGFGFTPVNSSVQAGNVADFLLRDKVTGRLEWVTPLTFANSTSNVIIGDAIEYADQASDGSLNQLSVYLFPPGDPRRINIDNMEVDARNWFLQAEPSFLSQGTGGQLEEFTPLGGNEWRAFGEIKGVVKRLLDVDATKKTPPKLTNLDVATGLPDKSKVDCGHPNGQSEIIRCIQQLSGELAPTG